MAIRAILAHDAYWGIGKNCNLPWPANPEDLQWFKECTNGKAVVMGSKTWASLPRKPLPNRYNAVVSSTMRSHQDIEIIAPDIYKSRIAIMSKSSDVWIIGGARLVLHSLPIIDELWLNNVGGSYDCDTHLPKQQITEQFYPASTETKSFGIITKWIKR